MSLLQVEKLTTHLRLGKRRLCVVSDLSFNVERGETLALVGESGCGKSMTALSLMRLLPSDLAEPLEGRILFRGEELLELPESRMRQIRGRTLSMVFQDPRGAFNPVYTIGTQLAEVAFIHLGLEEEEAKEHVVKLFEEVKLPRPLEHYAQYPHQLSGGMLQRAMIAMALICNPDLVIADEPTTALDVLIQKQILLLLRELQERRGMSLLLITHDMGVVAELADRVVVMYAGEKVEEAPAALLFDLPAHPYTRALFQARLGQGMRRGELPTLPGSVPSRAALPQGCSFHPRCPSAFERCKERSPKDHALDGGQFAKCWLYEPLA